VLCEGLVTAAICSERLMALNENDSHDVDASLRIRNIAYNTVGSFYHSFLQLLK